MFLSVLQGPLRGVENGSLKKVVLENFGPDIFSVDPEVSILGDFACRSLELP